MNQDLNDVFPGIQPINRSYWFGHVGKSGPIPAGSFPVTPSELGRPVQLGQGTISVFTWPGGGAPTALVLGPSSWGFGIGQWGSTAQYVPQQFPSHVQA